MRAITCPRLTIREITGDSLDLSVKLGVSRRMVNYYLQGKPHYTFKGGHYYVLGRCWFFDGCHHCGSLDSREI